MINVSGKITIGKIVNQPGSSFNGELQEKYNIIVPGWVARNQDGTLYLFVDPRNMDSRKFVRITIDENIGWWELSGGNYVQLDNDLFPDVKWEDEYPTEVTIKIL